MAFHGTNRLEYHLLPHIEKKGNKRTSNMQNCANVVFCSWILKIASWHYGLETNSSCRIRRNSFSYFFCNGFIREKSKQLVFEIIWCRIYIIHKLVVKPWFLFSSCGSLIKSLISWVVLIHLLLRKQRCFLTSFHLNSVSSQ